MNVPEDLINELRMGPGSTQARHNKLHGLLELINDFVTSDTVMVEIGCYRGASTELFALHCKKIYAIDPWSKVIEGKYVNVSRATRKMPQQVEAENTFMNRAAKHSNINPIKDFSYNVYDQFENNSLDLVYVDGHHSGRAVYEDVLHWFPKLKTGGVMAGHDFQMGQIKRVVDSITDVIKSRKRYRDGSWAFVKPKEGIEKEINY